MKREAPQVFLQQSYDRNNTWAVKCVEEMLTAKGYKVFDHPEDYGIDIVAQRYGELFHFEVEVKHNYPFTCMEDYRFPTVSFLGRKEKWKANGFWYIILCAETDAFVACHSDDIYKPEYKSTINVDSQERLGIDDFYRVPKELCSWSSLRDYANAA